VLDRASRRIAVVVGVAVLASVFIAALLGGDGPPVPVRPSFVPTPPGTKLEPLEDPFSYDPARRRDFEARAAAGSAHVLYANSPGGASATAARVARWRPLVEATAKKADVDADDLEGLIFLESAGREDAVAPQGTEGAAGLTQIVSGTATTLLGMHVDVARSSRLSRRLLRARSAGQAEKLRRLRRQADDRFDPRKALAATGRYLRMGEEKFASEELAFVSYHMGMGNLENVLRAYAGGDVPEGLRYAQVYFDTSPTRHTAAYAKLAGLGDDSSNYLWKLRAARDVMATYRTDPRALAQMEALQTAKNSAEEVLHPQSTVDRFATPGALQDAWDAGDILALPIDPARSGLSIHPSMGELAGKLDRPRGLYRGLRPEALAMALYIGAQTRAAAHDPRSSLILTSTVRDERYQRLLVRRNIQATRNYSLHTTGWTFDVLRRYRSRRQALAFQFVLDRLTALNLVAWVREPAAIHITVSSDAAALEPLLQRVGSAP
jgi:soluble lytic murein transglycosylase-like protein